MNIHSESIDRLFKTILQLGSIKECYRYFEDLCTIKEIQSMAQRLDTAILLSEGVSYQEIVDQVKISSATICRVNKCLQYGSGYRTVLERMKKAGKLPGDTDDTLSQKG